jgi:hypothetical protein
MGELKANLVDCQIDEGRKRVPELVLQSRVILIESDCDGQKATMHALGSHRI